MVGRRVARLAVVASGVLMIVSLFLAFASDARCCTRMAWTLAGMAYGLLGLAIIEVKAAEG